MASMAGYSFSKLRWRPRSDSEPDSALLRMVATLDRGLMDGPEGPLLFSEAEALLREAGVP